MKNVCRLAVSQTATSLSTSKIKSFKSENSLGDGSDCWWHHNYQKSLSSWWFYFQSRSAGEVLCLFNFGCPKIKSWVWLLKSNTAKGVSQYLWQFSGFAAGLWGSDVLGQPRPAESWRPAGKSPGACTPAFDVPGLHCSACGRGAADQGQLPLQGFPYWGHEVPPAEARTEGDVQDTSHTATQSYWAS